MTDTPHPGLLPHCGFSTAATWSVALFLDNDSLETSFAAKRAARHSIVALQNLVGRSRWRPENWVRYVSRDATLTAVDWRELREHLIAD